MSEKSALDLVEAHRYFSAECFNRAWDLIELPARTPEQDRTMLQLGLTSLWHWSQRPDRTPVGWRASKPCTYRASKEACRMTRPRRRR